MLTRRILLAVLVLGILLATVAASGLHYYRGRTGSVYHPNARFIPDPTPPFPPVATAAAPTVRTAWPMYGFTANHARAFPGSTTLRPPFRVNWTHRGTALLEFPPTLYGNSVFQLADDATLSSVDKDSGHVLWSRHLGALSASSPAVTDDTVIATIMQRQRGVNQGRVVAVDARTGATRWSRNLPSPSESSPTISGQSVYFGSSNGTVYALNTANGAIRWTYQAGGAVKASPTLAYGNLYFGDYSGQVQSISAQTGHRWWRTGSSGTLFGSGQFYSTAAVVDGRVFLGNTDGRIYAYDSGTGSLDWAVQTGAYVYSSPAVTNAPGLGPTVYSGSYDGIFYALSARTGHINWRYHAGGRISGSATIIGRVVYFADLGARRTIGLGVSTGRRVFGGFPGSFDPVVTDGYRVYLTGYTGLFALTPRDAPKTPAPTAPTAAVAAAAARAKGKSPAKRPAAKPSHVPASARAKAAPAARHAAHHARHQAAARPHRHARARPAHSRARPHARRAATATTPRANAPPTHARTVASSSPVATTVVHSTATTTSLLAQLSGSGPQLSPTPPAPYLPSAPGPAPGPVPPLPIPVAHPHSPPPPGACGTPAAAVLRGQAGRADCGWIALP